MSEVEKIGNVLVDIIPNSDARGEVVKIMTAQKTGWPARDVIAVSTNPGVVRGNHYHKEKKEVLVVVLGKLKVSLVHVDTGERKEFEMSGKKRQMLFINPNVAHSIKNIGDETAWFIEVQSADYSKDDDFVFQT